MQHHFAELIISPKELSRFGQVSIQNSHQLAQACDQKDISAILEWDILMDENKFKESQDFLSQLDLSIFKAVRVQDLGALEYLMENSDCKIQLNLETGNHNIEALQYWERFLGNRLDRLILSIELPKNTLKDYIALLKCPVEILGLGPILLFYTPRSLVAPHAPEVSDKYEITANSEESPHKGFRIIENLHGTFMFNPKDFSLIPVWDELEAMDLGYLRVDLRHVKDNSLYSKLSLKQNFNEHYPRPTIKGFYNINKSDVLFPKLKNARLQKKDTNFVGSILEVGKHSYLAVKLNDCKMNLQLGQKLKINHPEGKTLEGEIQSLRDVELNHYCNDDEFGPVVLLNYIKGASSGSTIFLAD